AVLVGGGIQMSLLTTFRASSESGSLSVPSVNAGDTETSDEFRMVKWHFLAHANQAMASGKNPRIILLTSARCGGGESYETHHLAANFALDPHVELTLIDANFSNPALGTSSWMGGSTSDYGLLDYLEQGSDQTRIVRSTGLSNVKVIMAGAARDHAPE